MQYYNFSFYKSNQRNVHLIKLLISVDYMKIQCKSQRIDYFFLNQKRISNRMKRSLKTISISTAKIPTSRPDMFVVNTANGVSVDSNENIRIPEQNEASHLAVSLTWQLNADFTPWTLGAKLQGGVRHTVWTDSELGRRQKVDIKETQEAKQSNYRVFGRLCYSYTARTALVKTKFNPSLLTENTKTGIVMENCSHSTKGFHGPSEWLVVCIKQTIMGKWIKFKPKVNQVQRVRRTACNISGVVRDSGCPCLEVINNSVTPLLTPNILGATLLIKYRTCTWQISRVEKRLGNDQHLYHMNKSITT